MKNFKSLLLAAVAAVALFSACSESDVLVDNGAGANSPKGAIAFGIAMPESATRASYGVGASFKAGDQMAVFGFQDTDNLLFNNQLVTSNGGNAVWTYSPVKYWQNGSSYEFYAFFPYGVTHTFGTQAAPYFSVPSFTVADDKDSQIDLMIAQKNEARPFNTVDLVFNHILSNVNFYFTVSSAFDMTGISNVTVNSFDVTGLYSTGDYAQTGFTGNVATGAWSNQSGTYDFPEVTTGSVTGSGSRATLSDDLLLMPQTISEDARVAVKYTLNYADGSASTFEKAVRLATIVGNSAKSGQQVLGVWNPNVRYNYYMAVNPSVSNIVYDGIDWNGTNNEDKVGDGDLVVENDDYRVDIDDDGAGDYPVVWEDVDGDGWLEGGVDRDGDGHIDDVDLDGDNVTPGTDDGTKETEPSDGTQTPGNEGKDVILVDKDGDGIPETQLVKPGSSNADDVVDNGYLVDYNGTLTGEQFPTHKMGKLAADDPQNPYNVNDPTNAYYQADNKDEFFYIDIDGNGAFDLLTDYPVVWKNIDDDDKLEGIADWNRNGVADDNWDGENTGYYVDADATHNPDGLDVILADRDKDGVAETQIERDPLSSNPDDNTENPVIEFTATVEDWDDEFDADVVVKD